MIWAHLGLSEPIWGNLDTSGHIMRAQEKPQEAPRDPKGAQETPKQHPEAPQRCPEALRGSLRGSPNDAKYELQGPKRASRPQDAPRPFPREPQEASFCRTSHAESTVSGQPASPRFLSRVDGGVGAIY